MKRKSILFFFMLFYSSLSMASELELEWQYYTSPPAMPTQFKNYVFTRLNHKLDFHRGLFYFNSHVQTEYSLDKSDLFYFNVPELYFFYKYDLKQSFYSIQSLELNVGRKIKTWSMADDYWDMDLWNPLSRWNPLHPQTNGLVGSFLTVKASQWTIDFFLGAVYLPNQESKTIEKDGDIYSHSRWFSPLPERVDPLNMDIQYSTLSPFIFDVLFQQSYIMSIKTWSDTSEPRYWMKWSLADKPVNHLFFVLNKNKLINIGEEEGAVANIEQDVTILPVRQRILSSEWGLDYKNFSAVFTLENSRLRDVTTRLEDWGFLNHRGSFTYFSALLKYNFSPKNFVQGGYMQSWFKDYNIYSDSTEEKDYPSILKKYKILEGFGLDWQSEFYSSEGLRRVFALNYRYSLANKGGWLFVKFLYYITPQIYTGLTFDILGAKSDKKGYYFLNEFRHNDYFAWRLAYDF